ncbi:MAG TPA: choice-of-anchor B family protein, partial [Bacteroidetes bacterium]|nr:choice-of-anchor B family protein [Bacteroidota bacterium]
TLLDTVEFPGQNLANIWGYASGGKEYALAGAAKGLYIVDVTSPTAPVKLEQLTDGINSSWREIKTYGSYAYVTSEGLNSSGDGGVGIADLSGLPAVPVPFHKYTGNGVIADQLHRAHALHVDVDKGYAYIYGTTGLANGGAVCLNLSPDPYNPVYAGQYNGSYIHDGYAHNDTVYGSHIYGGDFSIIDFTNKNSPAVVVTQTTPDAFTHNTWLTDDGNYLLTTDEKSNAYLTCYDISDPNDIVETDRIRTTPGSGSIVHNVHVLGNFAITSWYRDGITVTDISRPGNLIQVARYDTYPGQSGSGFQGAWGVYPYLPSGTILVSNIQESLSGGGTGGVMYLLSPNYPSACFLEGKVTDATTGQGLFGVSVEIQHSDPLNSTTSGLTGDYATGQPTSGTFDVVFTKTGYLTQTISVNLTNGAVTTQDVQMSSSALPIELLSFSARPEGSRNVLRWVTAWEFNTDLHEIQRKANPDSHWEALGRVKATGNEDAQSQYEFFDKNPFPISFYRLRTIDLDGMEHFSEVVSAEQLTNGWTVEKAYPVPCLGNLQLLLLSDRERELQLAVGDFSGRWLLEQPLHLSKGENHRQLILPGHWPNGLYRLRVAGRGRQVQQIFLLQR